MTDTRAFYDTIAEDYAVHFRDQLAHRPLERALLAAYAEQGPGEITAHLDGLGLSVFGLDLSESMITVARRRYPALRFERGSMRELSLAHWTSTGAAPSRWPGC